jgi:Holliday junction resolvase-like predicted endonuclease
VVASSSVTSIARHEVGLLGEHAVASWIQTLGAQIRVIGDDLETQEQGHGDLMVLMDSHSDESATSLLEVKTRRTGSWAQWRHEIDMGQLDWLVVAAVVWCVAPDRLDAGPVRIAGWSPPDELWHRWMQEAELANGDEFRVDWLDDWPVQPLVDLIALLQRPHLGSPPTPFD